MVASYFIFYTLYNISVIRGFGEVTVALIVLVPHFLLYQVSGLVDFRFM